MPRNFPNTVIVKLDDNQRQMLDTLSGLTKLTMSEIIRLALHDLSAEWLRQMKAEQLRREALRLEQPEYKGPQGQFNLRDQVPIGILDPEPAKAKPKRKNKRRKKRESPVAAGLSENEVEVDAPTSSSLRK
jgi:hypothetical protein